MYTYVVIDSPPILSVTDAAILGRVVDAVVLVVRHGKSSKNVMRRARDLMVRSGAPVAGLVMNAVDVNSPEYYGYYGYTGYSYGSADANSWEAHSTSAGDPRNREEGQAMTRGFLSETSANRSPVSQPRLSDIAGASRRRSRYVLTWALAAFCWTSGTGWARDRREAGSAASGRAQHGTGSSEAAGQATTAGAMPIAGESMLYPGEDFKLGPGDLISVRVFLEPDYQATVRVDADGNVLLPFIGSVNREGPDGAGGAVPDRGSPANRAVLQEP